MTNRLPLHIMTADKALRLTDCLGIIVADKRLEP